MQKSKGKLQLLPVETIAETEANFSVTNSVTVQLHCRALRDSGGACNCTVTRTVTGITMGRSSSLYAKGRRTSSNCPSVDDRCRLFRPSARRSLITKHSILPNVPYAAVPD